MRRNIFHHISSLIRGFAKWFKICGTGSEDNKAMASKQYKPECRVKIIGVILVLQS
jgi:hypothetical protein